MLVVKVCIVGRPIVLVYNKDRRVSGVENDMYACTQVLLAGKRDEYKLGAKIYMATLDKSRGSPLRRKEKVVW